MWELYDKLIDEVKEDVTAEEVIVGQTWTLTNSHTIGLAMSSPRPKMSNFIPGTCHGKTVKELAKLVKSWDFVEASIGLSAINSTINHFETIKDLQNRGYHQLPSASAFDLINESVIGKKVTVIGHFPNVDELSKICQLTVLERNPAFGDLPDPAAEYLLPEQDFVIMTSSTLINKTAPRLLELSKNAVTIMLGPSTPLSKTLFEMGVDMISGLVVEESGPVLRSVKEGGGIHHFQESVHYVNLIRNDSLLAELKEVKEYENV